MKITLEFRWQRARSLNRYGVWIAGNERYVLRGETQFREANAVVSNLFTSPSFDPVSLGAFNPSATERRSYIEWLI